MKSPEPLLLINCLCLKAREVAGDQNKERFFKGEPLALGFQFFGFEDKGVEQPLMTGEFLFMLVSGNVEF